MVDEIELQTNFFTFGAWQTLARFSIPRYFAGISKITFNNGTSTQVVTGGTTNGPPNGTTFYSTNTIDVLTSNGWIPFSPSVPVTIYSHGQVSISTKLYKQLLHAQIPKAQNIESSFFALL